MFWYSKSLHLQIHLLSHLPQVSFVLWEEEEEDKLTFLQVCLVDNSKRSKHC